jgi:hypothetical protein
MADGTFLEKFRRHTNAVWEVLQSIFCDVRKDPLRAKRIVKVAVTMAVAEMLTLPPSFARFYGRNPFLLGTVVCIKLFDPPPPSPFCFII